MSIKKRFDETPSLRITFRYSAIALVLLLAVSLVLPTILNYGPESINTPFDVEMSYLSYFQQFAIISIVVLLSLFLISKFLLKDIDKWYKLDDSKKYKDLKLIKKIRKKCFNLPYIIFSFEVIVPIILTAIFLFATGSHHRIMVFKILILIISFLLLLAVYSFIIAKGIYSEILAKTYSKDANIGFRIPIWKKIFIQILPIFITGILVTSLIGYSRTVTEKEDVYFSIYNKYLTQKFNTETTYSINEVISLLNSIELFSNEHSKFIILPNNELVTLSGPQVSDFVKQYTIQISEKYNGRTYDSYGVDTQGSTMKIKTDIGYIYVGLLYTLDSKTTFYFLIVNFFLLLALISFVLYLFGRSLSHELVVVSNGFNSIASNNKKLESNLPVVSNDEIGDLVISFNKIQKQQNEYLQTIKDNQEMLMEKERLASLGQLIGGIAHNLKTPIMSISGAAEGLSDLIKEYDSSIGDPEVNEQDHHDIAKDMSEWVVKIRNYTEYMSDVITAVKGQAVTLSDDEKVSFTVEELVKRVDILMKHELKNALTNLIVKMNVDPNIELQGNVNSLVQVINNMISNSIQAYNGKTNQNIDFIISQENNFIIFSIKDYAGGLPKEVSDKLFKEMVTTKGKNGTGLGLFMSYSNIRAHFNGNITFETEQGVGTQFNIILPL